MRSLTTILLCLVLFQSSFALQCFYQQRFKYNILMGLDGIQTFFNNGWVRDEAGVEECDAGVTHCFQRFWGQDVWRGCHYKPGACKDITSDNLFVSCCKGDLCNAPTIMKRGEYVPPKDAKLMRLRLPNQRGMEIAVPIKED